MAKTEAYSRSKAIVQLAELCREWGEERQYEFRVHGDQDTPRQAREERRLFKGLATESIRGARELARLRTTAEELAAHASALLKQIEQLTGGKCYDESNEDEVLVETVRDASQCLEAWRNR